MEAIDVVNTMIGHIERRDIDSAIALMADDVEYDNVPMATIHGAAAVRAALGPFLAGASDVRWTIHREASTGHLVFNERTDRFDFGDKVVEIAVAGVFEVHAGRITLWRDYFDLASYRNQMA